MDTSSFVPRQPDHDRREAVARGTGRPCCGADRGDGAGCLILATQGATLAIVRASL